MLNNGPAPALVPAAGRGNQCDAYHRDGDILRRCPAPAICRVRYLEGQFIKTVKRCRTCAHKMAGPNIVAVIDL